MRAHPVGVAALVFCSVAPLHSRANCNLTNTAKLPLPDTGHRPYRGFPTGLYPHYANNRPPAHLAASLMIATDHIKPRDAAGNVNTNTGKIALLSIGMSNTTQEWATKGTGNFKTIADADPAKNPQVVIVDGAQGGQDAVAWTNFNALVWDTIQSRLGKAGLTTNQVQAIWIKQALIHQGEYGEFPNHATALQLAQEQIVRIARARYPNLGIVYLSSRTRSYRDNADALNPEPFAYEGGFSVKWMIEKQINGAPELNYNPANGPVVAPLLSWGPYLWVDGLNPRGDGLIWLCSDLGGDYIHPSTNGVAKVGAQLLAFFKTDPTATPWFLRRTVVGEPPACVASADLTNGLVPLAVNFSAAVSGSVTQTFWTFDDGEFSTNANPVKTFRTPGQYTARLTVTDTNGNTAMSSIPVTVNTTFELWRADKFTTAELANPSVSGASANPDLDPFPNLLEYTLGLEPKTANPASLVSATVSNGVFSLRFPHLKAATDATLVADESPDLSSWNPAPVSEMIDLGPIETVVIAEPVAWNGAKFYRLRATR